MMQELVHSGNLYLSYVSLGTTLDPSKGERKKKKHCLILIMNGNSEFCTQSSTTAGHSITNTTKLQDKTFNEQPKTASEIQNIVQLATALPLLNKILL